MYHLTKKSNTTTGMAIIVTLSFGSILYDLICHPVKSVRGLATRCMSRY